MKYAIFVDVDGTLLDNKQQIPESAVYAIQNARKNGHYVFLNTGRCKAELFESILDVGFDGIICSSGGYIEYEGQCIRHPTFDENDIQSLIQYFEKNKIGYYLECNHGMYVDTLYQDWMQEAFKDFMPEGAEEYTSSMIVVDGSQQIYEVNKISFLCTLNNFDQIYKDLHEHFNIIKNTIPMIREVSGEISIKGIHKADAADILLKHIGLDHLSTIAIGDSDNDIELLQHVDIGICMGNGTEKCKAVCDEITDDVEHDGLYKSFVKHNLIESR